METFATIAGAAESESALWAAALLPPGERQHVAVFSALAPERFALGVETVYEAYLVHYGQSRLFQPGGEDERVLLGDYLYAHGLVRIDEAGGVEAVGVMADLISHCAALRAENAEGDDEAWVDAARSLGGAPDEEQISEAVALHFARVAQ